MEKENQDTRHELNALIKATEEKREELKRSWEKVKNLDAAVQAVKKAQPKSNTKNNEK
jgi:hypothetical protein